MAAGMTHTKICFLIVLSLAVLSCTTIAEELDDLPSYVLQLHNKLKGENSSAISVRFLFDREFYQRNKATMNQSTFSLKANFNMSNVERISVFEVHLAMAKRPIFKSKHLFCPCSKGSKEKECNRLQSSLNDTEVFNVTTMFNSAWRSAPKSNWEIATNVCDSNRSMSPAVFQSPGTRKAWKDNPFLIVFYKTESGFQERASRKVSASPSNTRSGSLNCKKVDLWVSFKNIKWPHIILPKLANLGYCKGTCLQLSLHAKALNRVKKLVAIPGMDKSHLDPCCAPAKLQDLRVTMKIDNQKMYSGILNDLVVSTCGCL